MEKKKETKRFDLMEFGSALGREEMKKLMAGSDGGCGYNTCLCSTEDCDVAFYQYPDRWEYLVSCPGDPEPNFYDGPGCYSGTLCFGECP